jgi:hypothetical protein
MGTARDRPHTDDVLRPTARQPRGQTSTVGAAGIADESVSALAAPQALASATSPWR